MAPPNPELRSLLLLDVETTGLDPQPDQLCEIGAVLFSLPHRAVIQQLSFLLPVTTNDAEAINGISPGLTQQPAPREPARALFLQLVAQADAFVAHNAGFDRPWIEAFLAASGCQPPSTPWICTCEGISWPDLRPNPSLANLALAHGVPVWSAHRALTDCIYLAQILERAPELEQLLAEGLEPRFLVAANLPFSRKDEARQAGFRWHPDTRQWRRRCTTAQIEALPFAVLEVDP
jgi:DNA polymerase III subunit epsilon